MRFLSGIVSLILLCAVFPSGAMTARLSFGEEDAERNFNYLMLEDTIWPKDASQVRDLLARQFKRKRRTAIVLTSPGGALEGVEPLARVILDASKKFHDKYGRSIFLVINQECGSACNILTATLTKQRNPEALEIYVAEDAKFLFHGPVSITGKKISEIRDAKERKAKREKMLEAYRQGGVDPKWLEENKAFFEKVEPEAMSASKLCREKTGIIPATSCYSSKIDIFDEIVKAMAGNTKVPTLLAITATPKSE